MSQDSGERDTGFTEIVEDLTGKKIKRYKSGNVYILGCLFLIIGTALLSNGSMGLGLFMVLTLFPICMLYPAVRFLFGGKDSVGAVVATAVVEEVLKNKIKKSFENKKKK
jgi:hypothetical protein